jgi:peptide methionine sulfoxide reductase msrA/msrB
MKLLLPASAVVMAAALSLGLGGGPESREGGQRRRTEMERTDRDLQKATFAGGCFWCVEADFEKLEGVVEVISGYSGGHEEDPTYEEVASGATGHA